MITLALGQCVWGLAYRWNSLTGGDDGINLRGRPNFGLDLSNEVTFFYLVFAFFAVSMMLMYVLVRSPFARSLAGIREHELRMQILGYNTWLHKYIAFIIAGGFGGLAGVLWAHTRLALALSEILPVRAGAGEMEFDDSIRAIILEYGRQMGGVQAFCAFRYERHKGPGPHERMRRRQIVDAVMLGPVHGLPPVDI